MGNALVSVVVPVYNTERYLKRCIDSILAQTYRNIEIILVNDGSHDKSPKICDFYSKINNRVRVIHNDNHGVSYSRNCGIKNAKGTYIAFFDSDDFVEADTIELMVGKMTDGTDLVVGGIVTELYDDYQYIKCIETKTSKLNIEYDVDSLNSKWDYIFKYNDMASPCNKLYKLNIINNEHLLFNERCFSYEDLLFNLNYLIYARRIVFMSAIVYHYCNSVYVNQKRKRIKQELFENATEFAIGAFNFINHYRLNSDSIIYSYIGLQYRRAMELLSSMNIPLNKQLDCLQKLSDDDLFNKYIAIKYKNDKYFAVTKYLVDSKMYKILYTFNYLYSKRNKLREIILCGSTQ